MLSGCKKPAQIAVFISGSGSTLQALLEMQHQIEIKLVVCNRMSAAGQLKAKRFGVPVVRINKNTTDEELNSILQNHKVDFIMLAGFMKLLSGAFVQHWQNRMINIHPSLLPAYKGLEAAEKSWNDNSDMGVSIHHVTEEMDEGRVVLQKRSLTSSKSYSFQEASIWLRQTEQHLLREVCYL